MSDLNYIIATPNSRKATRLCHVNLLKPFHGRQTVVKGENGSGMVNASACTSAIALSSSPAVSVEESATPDVVLRGRLKNCH